ncbi:hypothetical protein WISP_134201 [Willisornis vidua]|uniref:Uncharacterized protein n=1 Tax=Willisornis vidua TaxID=1566151 RepID=A0ABQ9CU35_9PASS|nr:hypothetical protein WISP_134201 [Willisornis vidua]
MAKVQVNNVVVLDNPSPFYNPFQFEITFECIEDLSEGEYIFSPRKFCATLILKLVIHKSQTSLQVVVLYQDLEWKIIYVGSAESEEYDQVLDSVLVGPVPAGRHMFVFQADAPNPGLIPDADAVGVTVVLITCTYRGQEFIRVGYYVNNEYTETELRENPPVKPDFSKLDGPCQPFGLVANGSEERQLLAPEDCLAGQGLLGKKEKQRWFPPESVLFNDKKENKYQTAAGMLSLLSWKPDHTEDAQEGIEMKKATATSEAKSNRHMEIVLTHGDQYRQKWAKSH